MPIVAPPACEAPAARTIPFHLPPRRKLVMAKTNTVLIKLVSTADTGYFYVTKKNPRKTTNKMELKKYDPKARKHVVFREAKIK